MKKIVALSLALGLSTSAFAFDMKSFTSGDGTYHVDTTIQPSNLTRAEVLSKTDSSNIANSMDATPAPIYTPSSTLTRADVIRKMEGWRYVEFGDGTSMNPWVKIK